MKKFFSLVLALVMALSLTTVAWGADLTALPADDADGTADDKITLTADTTITLSAPVTLEDTVVVSSGNVTIKAANPANPVTITTSVVKAFTVNGGTLTLGEGVTINSDKMHVLYANGGNIVVDGAVINVTNAADSAVYVVNGNVEITGESVITQSGKDVTTLDADGEHASITVSGGKVISADSNAICARNKSTVTISDGEVKSTRTAPAPGSTDRFYAAAVATEGATITVTGGVVDSAKGLGLTAFNYKYTPGTPDGGNVIVKGGTVGSVLAWESSDSTAIIEGGTVGNVGAKTGATVEIKGGTVTGAVTEEAGSTMTITGGEFAVAPSQDYLPTGMTTILTTKGTYVLGTVPAMGDKFDLYLADKNMNTMLALEKPAVSSLTFDEKGAKANQDGSGNVAYIVANNGEYYVKTTTPTTDSYAVTYTGKTTVLYYVDVVDAASTNVFEYTASVKEFTNFGLKCGQLNVTPAADDIYFQTAAGVIYKAATTVGTDVSKNYLLDGEVVTAGTAGTTAIDHSFSATNFKYDAVKKVNVPTEATCTKCLAQTSSIYLDGKVPATYKEYGLTNGGKYVVGLAPNASLGTVVPTTPSTDKVQSAETFDAGIAMYVGMSVMAAAGSAVVIGKKKD